MKTPTTRPKDFKEIRRLMTYKHQIHHKDVRVGERHDGMFAITYFCAARDRPGGMVDAMEELADMRTDLLTVPAALMVAEAIQVYFDKFGPQKAS
jgi:hypothetical protein